MKREELFEDFYNKKLHYYISWPSFREMSEEYLAENKESLPPAEGAEEILEALLTRIDKDVEKPFVTAQFGDMWRSHAVDHYDFPTVINIAWRQGRRALLLEKELRATLHAQRLADKMVSERLREDRKFTDWCINHVEIESREDKYIIDNETTIYSFEDLKDYWNKYLKA